MNRSTNKQILIHRISWPSNPLAVFYWSDRNSHELPFTTFTADGHPATISEVQKIHELNQSKWYHMLRNPIDHLDVPAKKTSQPRYQLPCSRTDCHSFCEVARGSLPSATTWGLGNCFRSFMEYVRTMTGHTVIINSNPRIRFRIKHQNPLFFIVLRDESIFLNEPNASWSVGHPAWGSSSHMALESHMIWNSSFFQGNVSKRQKYIRFCESKCRCHRFNPR